MKGTRTNFSIVQPFIHVRTHTPLQICFAFPATFMILFVTLQTFKIIMVTRRRGTFGRLALALILMLFGQIFYSDYHRAQRVLSFGNYVVLAALALFVVYSLPCGKPKEVDQQRVKESKTCMRKWKCVTTLACAISDALYNIYVFDTLRHFLHSNQEVNNFLVLPGRSQEEEVDKRSHGSKPQTVDTADNHKLANALDLPKLVVGGCICVVYAAASSGRDVTMLPVLLTAVVWSFCSVLPYVKCIPPIPPELKMIALIMCGWFSLTLVALLISGACFFYHFKGFKSTKYILGFLLGSFFLASYTIFSFVVFLVEIVLCVNAAATILFGFGTDDTFVMVMKFAVLGANFTMLFLLPKAADYVIHKFDSDEELKEDLDNYYEILTLIYNCLCCNVRSSQKGEARGTGGGSNPSAGGGTAASTSGAGARRGINDDGDKVKRNDETEVQQAMDKVWRSVEQVQHAMAELSQAMGEESRGISQTEREEEPIDIDWSAAAKKRFSYFCGIMCLFIVVLVGLIRIRDRQATRLITKSNFGLENQTLHFIDFYLHRGATSQDRSAHQTDETHTYSACEMRWGNLSALDHAILAKMAYYQPELLQEDLEAARASLDFTFPESLYKVSLAEDWESNKQRKQNREDGKFNKYYRFDFEDRKHTVIAVQGTDAKDLADVFADLRLWLVSGCIDVAQWIIPPVNTLLPHHRGQLQWMMSWLQEHMTIQENQVRERVP